MTKAWLYDEAVSKTGNITFLKLIHICVDYFPKMELNLAEMQSLFTARNRLLRTSPVSLDKVLDLWKFPDLPPKEVLQGLTTPTTLKTNPNLSESGLPKYPGSNANSKGVMEAQGTQSVLVSAPGYKSTTSDEASSNRSVSSSSLSQ